MLSTGDVVALLPPSILDPPPLIAYGCSPQALFSRCLQEAAALVEELREQEEDNSRPVTRGGQGRWAVVLPWQSFGEGILWAREGKLYLGGAGGCLGPWRPCSAQTHRCIPPPLPMETQLGLHAVQLNRLAPADKGRPLPTNTRSCPSPPRGLSWDRMLQLGQLGLTSADVARLLQLRRSMAARVIQRETRCWLGHVRHQRAVAAAQQRAAELKLKLRRVGLMT